LWAVTIAVGSLASAVVTLYVTRAITIRGPLHPL